ncbi:MAG TPA: hypothetical protein VK968_07465 [Roseimicrobium sp.]|nr:hypothetical protein [Roseimicrobium sp.]
MKSRRSLILLPVLLASFAIVAGCTSLWMPRQKALGWTDVSIHGENFHINGKPTLTGQKWRGMNVEGLLPNSRMVQGIFDDANSETVCRWAYPDTKKWDPERNTRELLAAMPEWRDRGLLAFTLNLQGGSPQGYSKEQPWDNSAFRADGSLKRNYLNRARQIIDRADQLGMVVILGYFYFGQDQRLESEAAVKHAVDNATHWVLENRWRNVLIEVNNECNVKAYDHDILKPARIHELIEQVKRIQRDGRRLLVGTSYGGGAIPGTNVVAVSDFLLLHGNGVKEPERIVRMVRDTRALSNYRPMPILFNEDDHFDFDQPMNNFIAATVSHASWGYFDPGESNYVDGYQCPPVKWGINTQRKREFFKLLEEMGGKK